jgi:mortality factor 4-like protein 1
LVQFFYEPDDGILHYEWLSESELYPYEFKSKQLKVFYQASPVPKFQGELKKMSSIKKGGNKQKAKWTKKKKEPIEEDAFDSDNDSHLKIPIPAAVRKRLLDDGTMINTEKTVVPLPKKPNVHEILTAFFQEATSIKEDPTNPLDITVNDFTRMFNIYIGLALLYRYERPQYEQIFNQRPKVPMAAVYGAEHLLRLCAKLPSLIVKFNENTALIPVVLELMMFLKDNMTAYFVDEYSETDDNYFIKLYS